MKRRSKPDTFLGRDRIPRKKATFPGPTACQWPQDSAVLPLQEGKGLVAMKTHRMRGMWDLGGSHHLEDLRGVLAVGP